MNLQQLEELMKKATQKEWVLNTINDWPVELNLKQDDARFIFALANAFPSFLKTLRAYEETIEKVRNMDIKDDDTGFEKLKVVSMMQNRRWRLQRDSILSSLDDQLKESE